MDENKTPPPVTHARGSAEAVGDPYAWLFHDPPPAPSQHVTVKQLRWKGPDSSGEYHSLDGLWGYVIRARNGNGYWLSEVGEYRMTVDAAKAAAQADYERRVLAALDPSPAPRETAP